MTIDELLHDIVATESRKIYATLVRLLGDFDLAEESMQDAFTAALEKWPSEGVPQNPVSWIISTARFKGIDTLRRSNRLSEIAEELAQQSRAEGRSDVDSDDHHVADDQLRMIFTCCHPALSIEAQIALTLREVCGLTTEEIAKAFLTSPSTLAQRIVRAKSKIRAAKIPYQIPQSDDLPGRIDGVLSTIYLVFNEGYAATHGESLIREELSQEAIRLGRLIHKLLPSSDTAGLLALMLFQESRRATRIDANGDIVLLENQDRSCWDRIMIDEASALLDSRERWDSVGPYFLQAMIASTHAHAPTSEQTNWRQISALYNLLYTANPSPVVALNRIVAHAMTHDFQSGLQQILELENEGTLDQYFLLHATKADFYRRLGRREEALQSYRDALNLTTQGANQRFLQRRIAELCEN